MKQAKKRTKMTPEEIQLEKTRITEAWERFSNAVLAGLLKKAEAGKTGWDKSYPRSSLFREMNSDLRTVQYSNNVSRTCTLEEEVVLCQNIAAYAMFLAYRAANTPTNQS
jgi:hypothetical protein